MTDNLAVGRGAHLLRQSDFQAERLIAILRMVLSSALFLGVSGLLLNLDTAGLTARRFELVLLLFGAAAYFTLGVVNFYFSDPKRFKFWQSWLFNALEVGLLGAQLYIDVSDPTTPSLIALASPLLLVATLVLTIQALRYRLELHIFTALLLLAVCTAVTFHNPLVDQPWSDADAEEMRILYSPPPNVMRFVILATLALVVGTAVYRSRRLVLRVAKEVEDADNLRRFLPGELRADLSDEALRDLRTPQRRDVAILMMDLRGFTEMTETLGASQVAEVLTWFRSLVIDAAGKHNGIVDKFVGDNAMLIFDGRGSPETSVSDAIAAFHSVMDGINHRNRGAAANSNPIEVATGIHRGSALIGAFGDDRRLEFTALGTTVNVASRLEAYAKTQNLQLVISDSSIDVSDRNSDQNSDQFIDLGRIAVKGLSEPIGLLGLRAK